MNDNTGTFANICLWCISAAFIALAVVSAGVWMWAFMVR
jgi:hypothetical protein